MKLAELYKSLDIIPKFGEKEIMGLTADSREVKPGWLFVAEPGVNVDGHNFIKKALDSGAIAIVCNKLPDYSTDYPDVEWTVVPNSAIALGALADQWYGNPSSKLTLIGVTGTNGKTTIATLIYDMARLMGKKAGLLSTVANKINDKTYPATHTTPDALNLHRLLSEMVEDGCTICAMEVSSHACHQYRIAGLKFDGAVFTNLTRDHLDYHKTFANYLAAKKSFFDGLSSDAFALTNIDDRNGMVMLQNTKAHKHSYSLRSMADFKVKVIEDRLDGMTLDIDGAEVATSFTGGYNASNLAAVYGVCRLLGWNKEDILKGISQLHPVAGRMQTLHSPTGITAIVDYAHTPDALVNTLDAISETLKKNGNQQNHRIITVAGAGGDRDHGKRPLMAAEAVKRSDLLVLTSDNPRTEDPTEIINQMLAGVPEDQRDKVVTILDRAQAIAYAIGQAHPGDAVLVAGKGHEDYQIIGTQKHHFDDREEVLKCFQS